MKTILALLLLSAPLSAQTVDDSDIAGPLLKGKFRYLEAEARHEPKTLVFPLGRIGAQSARATAGAVTGAVELLDAANTWRPARMVKVKLVGPGAADAWTPVDDTGRFSIPAPAALSGAFKVRVSFDNAYWTFHNTNTDSSYEWEGPEFSLSAGGGADAGKLWPEAGSDNAKLGVLHLTYLDALDFLKRNADVDWWTSPLTINWPSSGDFYSPGAWSLDLTDPTRWDVVTHELGHAVQAGAMNARSAGGSHKIDECYSSELAWSEGWASFFACAVHNKLDDADAKFQYMVPRRAPIRIENVPDDVCKGEASEWRVFAGLWDLVDTHDDGLDHFAMPFSQLWKSLRGQSMGSMTEAWALIRKDLDPRLVSAAEDALIQNTLLPARAPLTVALPEDVRFDAAPR